MLQATCGGGGDVTVAAFRLQAFTGVDLLYGGHRLLVPSSNGVC